ncbi:helix-turn-helix domain-containing protein [Clostridium tertium]|jgi:predicted DNA-binding transcriptional regulator AlpA|uniref:helix-turn-helix domain-containing protein n=1 Tax=Clostridium tertium TaxID=1559 RepID=UPI002A8407E4|nr:helix-turn-helix domain-containing protein [Clostridium tertium]MDY4605858.1 helix-turn-helix domain-containing protein [Clostridium tertium]
MENNEMFNKFLGMLVDVIAEQVKEQVKDFKFNTEDEKLVLLPNEAMEALGVGRNTMYEDLLKRDDFPCYRINSKFYIPKKELSEWVSSQCKRK